MNYPFNSITINGREVAINSICSNSETPQSEFESHTFSFIKDWFEERTDFNIKTSGSTGDSKIISITRQQMMASAHMTIKALKLTHDDVALVCLNTQFIAGRMMLVRAFEAQMRIHVTEPSSDPFHNLSLQPSFMAVVPLQLQTLVQDLSHREKLNRMKSVIVGGAAVTLSLHRQVENIDAPVYATYGMTETLSHIALQRLNGPHKDSCFHTLPGIKIGKDERGCLVLTVPYLTEKIITNDLVEVISTNRFKWLGRWDNVINSGGLKIIPEVLEQKIKTIFNTLSIDPVFFISSVPDERFGNKIVIVMERSNVQLRKEDLLSIIKQSLPKNEAPKDIVLCRNFFYTSTGKINRRLTIQSI